MSALAHMKALRTEMIDAYPALLVAAATASCVLPLAVVEIVRVNRKCRDLMERNAMQVALMAQRQRDDSEQVPVSEALKDFEWNVILDASGTLAVISETAPTESVERMCSNLVHRLDAILIRHGKS